MNKTYLFRHLFFALAVTFAVSFFCGCSSSAEPASVLLKKAILCGQNAKWEKALSLVQEAEKQNPKNADILLFHVLALENNGKMDEALFRIRQLAITEPGKFEVQYTLGRLLFASGNCEQALVPLQNALQAQPGDTNTTLLLAKTCIRLKKYKQSLNYYKQLTLKKEFRTLPEIYNEIGVLYALLGRPDYALIIFRDKGSTFPVSVLNHAIICDFHGTGDKAEATSLYGKYLRMTANQPELDQERIRVTQRLQELR